MEPFRLLCTGDVHLGRRPSRVPPEDDMLAVSYVWKRFIDAAIDRDVDAVVLTGDIVDAENKMYEAFGALERGIQQLLAADISVVAVAGNHDYDAFPRLVSALDDERFHTCGSSRSRARTLRLSRWQSDPHGQVRRCAHGIPEGKGGVFLA